MKLQWKEWDGKPIVAEAKPNEKWEYYILKQNDEKLYPIEYVYYKDIKYNSWGFKFGKTAYTSANSIKKAKQMCQKHYNSTQIKLENIPINNYLNFMIKHIKGKK